MYVHKTHGLLSSFIINMSLKVSSWDKMAPLHCICRYTHPLLHYCHATDGLVNLL